MLLPLFSLFRGRNSQSNIVCCFCSLSLSLCVFVAACFSLSLSRSLSPPLYTHAHTCIHTYIHLRVCVCMNQFILHDQNPVLIEKVSCPYTPKSLCAALGRLRRCPSRPRGRRPGALAAKLQVIKIVIKQSRHGPNGVCMQYAESNRNKTEYIVALAVLADRNGHSGMHYSSTTEPNTP